MPIVTHICVSGNHVPNPKPLSHLVACSKYGDECQVSKLSQYPHRLTMLVIYRRSAQVTLVRNSRISDEGVCEAVCSALIWDDGVPSRPLQAEGPR